MSFPKRKECSTHMPDFQLASLLAALAEADDILAGPQWDEQGRQQFKTWWIQEKTTVRRELRRPTSRGLHPLLRGECAVANALLADNPDRQVPAALDGEVASYVVALQSQRDAVTTNKLGDQDALGAGHPTEVIERQIAQAYALWDRAQTMCSAIGEFGPASGLAKYVPAITQTVIVELRDLAGGLEAVRRRIVAAKRDLPIAYRSEGSTVWQRIDVNLQDVARDFQRHVSVDWLRQARDALKQRSGRIFRQIDEIEWAFSYELLEIDAGAAPLAPGQQLTNLQGEAWARAWIAQRAALQDVLSYASLWEQAAGNLEAISRDAEQVAEDCKDYVQGSLQHFSRALQLRLPRPLPGEPRDPSGPALGDHLSVLSEYLNRRVTALQELKKALRVVLAARVEVAQICKEADARASCADFAPACQLLEQHLPPAAGHPSERQDQAGAAGAKETTRAKEPRDGPPATLQEVLACCEAIGGHEHAELCGQARWLVALAGKQAKQAQAQQEQVRECLRLLKALELDYWTARQLYGEYRRQLGALRRSLLKALFRRREEDLETKCQQQLGVCYRACPRDEWVLAQRRICGLPPSALPEVEGCERWRSLNEKAGAGVEPCAWR